MFEGIDREEILAHLQSGEPIFAGSVRHIVKRKDKPDYDQLVCRLISTDNWIRIMNTTDSTHAGIVQITWVISQNLMFTLEFPRYALQVCRQGKSRCVRVRVAQAKLFVGFGTDVQRLPLSRPPEYIEFGERLQTIPVALAQAAEAYAKLHPESESSVA